MADTETTNPAANAEAGHDAAEHTGGHAHPSDREYVKVAILLAVITAAEVGCYYVEDALGGLIIPILTVMAITKFAIVVMWFMHLRFDNKLFRRFFVTGIILAMFCFVIVIASMHGFS